MRDFRNLIWLVPVVILSVVAISCGGGDKGADSDTLQPSKATLAESQSDTLFMSADLEWKDLQGNVRECVTMRYQAFMRDSMLIAKTAIPESVDTLGFTYSGMIERIVMWAGVDAEKYQMQNTVMHYDDKGVLQRANDTSLGKEMSVEIVRDENGYISKIARIDRDLEVEAFSDMMVWENGKVAEYTYAEYDMMSTWERRYDQEGHLSSEKSTYVSVEEGGENILTYNYLSADSVGNWTEREIVSRYVSISYDLRTGVETRMTEPETYYIERRQIEYYSR